jgi:hypothetical protein
VTIILSPAEALGRVPSRFTGVMVEPEPNIVGKPCACGELVWADPAAPFKGVALHNQGVTHRAWVAREEEL